MSRQHSTAATCPQASSEHTEEQHCAASPPCLSPKPVASLSVSHPLLCAFGFLPPREKLKSTCWSKAGCDYLLFPSCFLPVCCHLCLSYWCYVSSGNAGGGRERACCARACSTFHSFLVLGKERAGEDSAFAGGPARVQVPATHSRCDFTWHIV